MESKKGYCRNTGCGGVIMRLRLLSVWIIVTSVLLLVRTGICLAANGIIWTGSLEASDIYQSNTGNIFGTSLDLKGEINNGENQRGMILFKYSIWNPASTGGQDPGSMEVYQAYLDLFFGENQLYRIGRQKISWGSGFAWNPTNYVGIFKNRADLEALNPGVDAVNYEINWGNTAITLVLRPPTDGVFWGYAGKYSFQAWNSDIAISVFQQETANAFGLDYATSVGIFSPYIEVASKTGKQFYLANDGIGNYSTQYRSSLERYLHGVLGANCNLPNDVFLLLEYYYNQEGWSDQEFADYLANKEDLTENIDDFYGELRKNYLNFTVSKSEVIDDLDIGVTILYNLDDNSYQLTPKLEYQVGESTILKLMLNYHGGNPNSEFGPLGNQLIARATMNF